MIINDHRGVASQPAAPSPENPPANLQRYACPRCKVKLSTIQHQGCKSKHHSARHGCNRTGWGSLHHLKFGAPHEQVQKAA